MLPNPQKIAQTTAFCASLLMLIGPSAVVAQNHLHPLPVLKNGLLIECERNGIAGFVMIQKEDVFCQPWYPGPIDPKGPSILGGSIDWKFLTPEQKDAVRAVTEAQGQNH